MKKDVNDLYSIVKEEKSNIENLKNIIKCKGNLTQRISIVTSELSDIKNDLNILENNIKEELSKIENIENKIIKISKTEIIDKGNIIVDILIHNLPKDIKGEVLYDVYIDEYEKVINLIRSNNIIGEISVYSKDYDILKVRVKLLGTLDKQEEFIIKEDYRIYKIIAFIHTNLCYDE